jgi:4-hydroxy-tetrahydrodipicolinate reductase
MVVKVIISGVYGRMGTKIYELSKMDKEIEVVGALEKEGHPKLDTKLDNGVVVVSELSKIVVNCDVLIEFTTPEATLQHLRAAKEYRKAAVVGTTGFNSKEESEIKEISQFIPIVKSPNMSLGVNVLLKAIERIVAPLNEYDIEIIEYHHNQKKDAPSGTALRFAEVINSVLKPYGKEKRYIFGREGAVGARSSDEMGIFAVRAGDIVGEHVILLAGPGEHIEVRHSAHSRDTFAYGAIRAAKWVVKNKISAGLYSMFDVLGL